MTAGASTTVADLEELLDLDEAQRTALGAFDEPDAGEHRGVEAARYPFAARSAGCSSPSRS